MASAAPKLLTAPFSVCALRVMASASRVPGEPKTYVQDRMRATADEVTAFLKSDKTHVYLCGLKGMEARVRRRCFLPLLNAPRVEGRLGEWSRMIRRVIGHGPASVNPFFQL